MRQWRFDGGVGCVRRGVKWPEQGKLGAVNGDDEQSVSLWTSMTHVCPSVTQLRCHHRISRRTRPVYTVTLSLTNATTTNTLLSRTVVQPSGDMFANQSHNRTFISAVFSFLPFFLLFLFSYLPSSFPSLSCALKWPSNPANYGFGGALLSSIQRVSRSVRGSAFQIFRL